MYSTLYPIAESVHLFVSVISVIEFNCVWYSVILQLCTLGYINP